MTSAGVIPDAAGVGHHRGAHPDDARLFAESELPRLRRAAEEVAWLEERGWSSETALAAVTAHHQLEARQRLALSRAIAPPSRVASRLAKILAPEALRGRALEVDGFNVVITLEVALGGGPILVGPDGAPRDLAGLRGSYRLVDETEQAIALTVETLASMQLASVRIFLDAPVSNSGRLAAALRAAAPRAGCPVDVVLVPNADTALAGADAVASSDAIVIERAGGWLNLTGHILDARVRGAWRVRFDV
jgi:hypothetical protein